MFPLNLKVNQSAIERIFFQPPILFVRAQQNTIPEF